MKKRLRNFLRSPAHVLYPLGVLVLLGTMVLSFAADSLAYALGILHEQTITLDDAALYTLVNMERTDAQTLTAVNGDAQLLLQPGQRVRTLRLAAQYPAGLSCEMDLYWHLPGGGYTAARRIWPTVCADGAGWNYTLPWLAGQNLRLDLADQGGAAVTLSAVVLNERIPWYRYFIPTGSQLLALAAVPGLLACMAALLRDTAEFFGRKRKERDMT